MREVYSQDVGNPLQRDRLPRTTPTISFGWKSPVPPEAVQAFFAILPKLMLLVLIGVYAERTIAKLDQPFAALATVLLMLVLSPVVVSLVPPLRGTLSDHLPLIVSGGMLVVAYVTQFAFEVRVICTLFAVSLLTWLFARHHIGCATTTPLSPEARTTRRRAWTVYAVVMSAMPLLVLVFAGVFSHLLALKTLATLAAIQLLAAVFWSRSSAARCCCERSDLLVFLQPE